MELLISILTITANIILGLIVYSKNPRSNTNRMFAALTTITSAWTITNFISIQISEPSLALFWIRVVMSVAVAMFPCIYLLAKTFPNIALGVSKKHLLIIILSTIGIQLLSLSQLVFSGVTTSNNQITPTPGPAMPIYAGFVLFHLISSIIYLFKRRKASSGMAKTQISFMLYGLSITFILATISSFLLVVLFKFTNLVILGPTYTLFLVATMAYAIVKHRFLDIGLIVARAVSYTLVSIIIVTAYAAALLQIPELFPSNYRMLASICLALLLVFTFNPLLKVIERLTRKVFYKQTYDPGLFLSELGSIIRSNINLHSLLKNVLEIINDNLRPTSAAFVVLEEDQVYQVKIIGDNQKLKLDSEEVEVLISGAKRKFSVFDELEESPIKSIMRSHGISISLPLTIKSKKHGLLLLSEKASGEAYSSQDLQILEIFTPQISLAVNNALAYDQIQRFNVTLKDEVESATRSLKQANRNLRHLDKLKDEFVYIATHELKNPVTAMRGYLSLINEGLYGEVPKKLKDPLTQLNASNQQLVTLVNDLLQIARSEAKSITIHTEVVDVCSIIQAVIGTLKPLADQKKIKLAHHCLTKQLFVKADPDKLREIFNNLVSNAIKYSENGTISVYHIIEQGMVVTHVKDQGYGIAEKDQKKLFTRFYRVEEQVAKGIPGTGLGLFIVKQLIEKMGGRIWFTSKPGTGTTFSFSLPQG